MDTLKLKIDGMHCGGCADRLTSLVEKENGVKEVFISADAGTGNIAFGASSTSKDKIIAIIEGAGFSAEVA